MKLTQSLQTSKASNTHKEYRHPSPQNHAFVEQRQSTTSYKPSSVTGQQQLNGNGAFARTCLSPRYGRAGSVTRTGCARTAFSCRVSTNERSTGREPPRFSELWLATRLPLACHKHACRDRFRSLHQTYLLLDCR